ncbi:hypothetical protein LEP1GSC133_5185 [Leptospira borgpetersenii serovar Pomona str. 200901868]|uniref:Uncharacterized protein n=1 Tax=Leptospira borgpetersenii serovar Pomona str. 200901868 TaxID=1192866 RepID=M6VTM5_LEPBO|nr:hypothetical protein LEP1GSC133_5185 [Leptospira borgpetersenii serovar Pomona str. 200901868]
MKKIISSSIFVFLISSVSLRSEVLFLKSGKQVVGNIINQDKETVTFKLTDGTTKVFQKSVIRKISFTKIADPIFKKEEISKNKEETQGKKKRRHLLKNRNPRKKVSKKGNRNL